MARRRSWTITQLAEAVRTSRSMRQVIHKLGLVPAGGNYDQLDKYIRENKLDTSHFTGKGWSNGMKKQFRPVMPLEVILQKNSEFQSYHLKLRLFMEKLKPEYCELCGWAEYSIDGRLPLELDHINGDRHDNRLVNLRILCPNCHSLQATHRGRNRRSRRPHAGVAK